MPSDNSTLSTDASYIDAIAGYYEAVHQARSSRSHELRWLIGKYLDELISAGIPNPLTQQFTLGAVFTDLVRLARDQAIVESLERELAE